MIFFFPFVWPHSGNGEGSGQKEIQALGFSGCMNGLFGYFEISHELPASLEVTMAMSRNVLSTFQLFQALRSLLTDLLSFQLHSAIYAVPFITKKLMKMAVLSFLQSVLQ